MCNNRGRRDHSVPPPSAPGVAAYLTFVFRHLSKKEMTMNAMRPAKTRSPAKQKNCVYVGGWVCGGVYHKRSKTCNIDITVT